MQGLHRKLEVLPLSVVIIGLLEILHHTVESSIPGFVNHDASWRLPPLRQTEATVTYPPAWRTHPGLVQENCLDVFSVAIQEAWPTELTSHSATVGVVTDRLGIHCLLPTLMAGGTVDAIVDLLRRSLGYLPDFPASTDWLVIQLDRDWLVFTESPLSAEIGGELSCL